MNVGVETPLYAVAVLTNYKELFVPVKNLFHSSLFTLHKGF